MTDELETGELLGHYSCPSCGGSDPLALYEKSDCVDGNCWSNCGHFKPSKLKELGVTDGVKEVLVEPAIKSSRKGGFVMTDEVVEKVQSILDKEIHGWPERRIPALVNEFYGVRSEVEGDGVDKVLLREYCPSYNQKDQLVGWHVRDDKVKQARNNGEKSDRPPFYSIGDVRSSTKLFGQNKFEGGGKTLVIVSGQADTRAIFTALNTEKSYDSEKGRKVTKVSRFITPVVSTQSGEGSLAQFKSNYEWVSSFKSVIIVYDQDDAGREGAEKLARMLKAGQAKIAKLQRKDACEHSKRGEWESIRGAYFKAEQYSPVDVLHLAEMWDDFEKEDQNIKIPFPPAMSKLNEMMNGGMEYGEVSVVGALTSIGKGLLGTDYVITPDGTKLVSDVKVGDSLVGSDGRPTKVTGVFPQGIKKIFKITLNDDTVLKCDEDHLWAWRTQYQRRNNRENNVTNVYEMIESMNSGKSRSQIYLPDPVPVKCWEDDSNLVIDPYTLGIIIGDGSSKGSGLIVTNFEQDIIDKVSNNCPKGFKVVYNENLGRLRITIDHSCEDREKSGYNGIENSLLNYLKEVGLTVNSYDKFIPDNYLKSSYQARLELLRGLIDTDGSVTVKNAANIEYSTTSEKLADDVRFLVRSLGGTARVVKRNSFYSKDGERTQVRDSYRVFIKQPVDVNFFSSEKHKSRFKQGRTSARNEVVNIEEDGYDETICFKVEADDSLFMMKDFVLTHNTTFIMNIIHHLMENTDLKTGAFFLEGNKREIVRDLISLDLRSNLRLKDREEIDMGNLRKRFMNNLAKRDNFVYVDHQGSIGNEEIFDKFNYLSEVEECDVIVFDVLQAACDSSNNSSVIEFMDNILKFAKKTDTCVIVVSHMRKPDGDNPHAVSEYHLLGSSAINQIAYNTLLLSRAKMHEDKNVANSTKLQLVKCRRTGITGEAGWIRYDNETSHFYPTGNPYDSLDEPDETLFGDVGVDEQDYDKVEEQESSQDWEVVDE